MKWVAFYQPADLIDLTKIGFDSKKSAEAYVLKKSCKLCKEDVKKGDNIMFTMCGCEWLVIKQHDYYKSKGDHFELMKAAGWKVVDKNNNPLKPPK